MIKKITTILILFLMLLSLDDLASASSKLSYTIVKVELLSEAIQKLRNDIDRFPTEEEGLRLLVEPTPELKTKWHGPYLKTVVPIDPWKNEYAYHYPSRYGNKEFDLYSFGRNGLDDHGEKDDITNWKEVNEEYYGGLSRTENTVVYLCGTFLLIVSSIFLASVGKPVFSNLPRRFAVATSISLLTFVAWGVFSSLSQDRISEISKIFLLIYLFGFSIIGTIISIVSIKKGLSTAKGMLLTAVNASPLLLTVGIFIYLKIMKI